MPNLNIELALRQVKRYLNCLGWSNLPRFRVTRKTLSNDMLGAYTAESQFDGEAIIEVDFDAILKYDLTDPQTCLKVTILHEFAHMAHEAVSTDSAYPKFGEFFSDEEDMCEWFGWGVVMGYEETIRHPYFGPWLNAVDNFYAAHL